MKTVKTLARLSPSALLVLAACSNLTAPPSPEPIATDTSITAATAPKPPPPKPAASDTAPTPPPPQIDPNAKLQSTDITVGKGQAAKTGDTVSVHYVGTLADGKEFDSSRKRNQPFTFTIGQGSVIKGWDQGVVGMKVGGKRKLVIPPALAYGPMGRPPVIPPAATLTFEIELVEVKK